jgi:ubiquinone/menaquinone biosynthesis C-methylase UbiE
VKTTQELVRNARDRFNRELHGAEYRRIHSDDDQLRTLIDLLGLEAGNTVLDLGTGAGYVAFEIGRRYPECGVIGTDVADIAIAANIEKKEKERISNVDFRVCSGTTLPFDDVNFSGVITRYAFHHFPEPEVSVAEMNRILRRNGRVVVSDPVPFDADTQDFIDEFQRLRPDGHMRFYRTTELDQLFAGYGLQRVGGFSSQISYPRPMDPRYQALLKRTPSSVLSEYRVRVVEGQIWVTVDVANSAFQKR